MAHTVPQSPITQLPVELLSYIFVLSAHTPDPEAREEDSQGAGSDDISPCLSSSSTTPDVLASVSRHWRGVARNTPRLWTRLCVTIGDVMYHKGGPMFSLVSRYVSRSGQCPLDIFVDARDPEWDFSESDSIGAIVSPYIDLYDYTHPFKAEHMHHVLNILIPHVHRFRSLAILTDRWAPMQTALDCLSMEIPAFVSTPRPLPSSLPMLETLVLMRCNEFASYHSDFSPADRKDPVHLPFGALLSNSEDARADAPVLPRLKKLVLSGVHTQWSRLPRLLPPQHSPMESLELSYHCSEVRPSERECKTILERCPQLKELKLRVSGPKSPQSPESCENTHAERPVSLPDLETIVMGYDDPYAAATVLDMVDAPNVRELTLEDSSSPGREDRLDAEPLLRACAVSSVRGGEPAFPRVEALSMQRVDASAEAFEMLYGALPGLRVLSVSQMFLLGASALRPDVRITFEPSVLPPSDFVVDTMDLDGGLLAHKLALPREVLVGVKPDLLYGAPEGVPRMLW
ncbi:hypothetical protein K466DRAFT_483051 [Polyporus arcularius HHB13444]|uniref:Uncharacterized protein n=1 Tax=Polyporus arcularius HHB13444 TaxID=1314778 RepID=A0A5C3PYW2_9APHY|nr:hypothetical protein K466DRAFT_483051 [Polyporus arcularius HHB13444]